MQPEHDARNDVPREMTPLQVSTLLSKAEEAVERPRVTPQALQALEDEVSTQGSAVAEAKAVGGLCTAHVLRSDEHHALATRAACRLLSNGARLMVGVCVHSVLGFLEGHLRQGSVPARSERRRTRATRTCSGRSARS